MAGNLGDCWFISAMAVCAEGGSTIPHALRLASAEAGTFQVRMCIAGVWTAILIDDLLPCSPASLEPAFASGLLKQYWPT